MVQTTRSVSKVEMGTSVAGKTIIITGGNSGLGFEAARQFLVLKAYRVIITVRSKSKGQEAVLNLKEDSAVKEANPGAIIEAFELDLDDYQSGIQFVQKVKSDVKELDILLCNGGVNIIEYQTSKSGHERVMQVNCYTHFLVALELLPLLRTTARSRGTPSRLTFVGAGMHTRHKENIPASETILAYFDDKKVYSRMVRYVDAKLAINAWVRALAGRVPSSEMIINNMCPGIVATGFDKTLPVWMKSIMFVARKVLAISTEDGGRKLIYAAAVSGKESHGKFLQNNSVDPNMPFLDSPAGKDFSERLWGEIIAESRTVDQQLQEPRL